MTIQEIIHRKYKENLNLTNEERAQRAEAAIAAYPGGDPEDLTATIVDLVTDLMHLAHLNDIEPDYVAQQSADHYTAPHLEKLEILPAKSGECHIRIRFIPSLYTVPYERVLVAVGKILGGK